MNSNNQPRKADETMEKVDVLPETYTLTGAKIYKQPNGASIYVIFEGTEQAITDAFNTLWNYHALNGELETLNAYQSLATTTPEQFKHGLLQLEAGRAMDALDKGQLGDKSAYKGKRGGFKALIQANAERVWQAIQSVRWIRDDSTYEPHVHRMGGYDSALDDFSGRQDSKY